MRQSENIGELAKALSAVQGELEDVGKARQGHGYKYADLGQVLAEVRPALSRHGLAIVQGPGRLEERVMSVESILLHESGQWVSTTASAPVEQKTNRDGVPTMSLVQSVGVVITYLRRYCLASLVGLTQVDDDGSYTQQEPPARQSYSRSEQTQARTATKAETPATRQPDVISQEQSKTIWRLAKEVLPGDTQARLMALLEEKGWPVRSADLTSEQADRVIAKLRTMSEEPPQ